MSDNITTGGLDFDPFAGDSPMTPGLGSFKNIGTGKLLVVIFMVDCSRTMDGDRIGAVNAALQDLKFKLTELKDDNNLDLKVAVMSFTSTARWELPLTPIEEVNFELLQTRAGLTEYGAAFHELNKVLRKEQYMKHTGKIAPPAIIFLTDGEPSHDYQTDLDELLQNAWFVNASRGAILLGDAIYNEDAKAAVRQFVKNEAEDIVTTDDSSLIIQKIQIATMHTVAGDPIQKGEAQNGGGVFPAPNPDPTGGVFPDPDPTGGVFPDPDPTGGVFPDPDPTGGVFPDPDPADPVFPGPIPDPSLDPNFDPFSDIGGDFGGDASTDPF